MSLNDKIKTALDETRLLILGAQVLFGFQLQGVFQEKFAALDQATRDANCIGQVLMVAAIGLLIAPGMQHQIVDGGQDTLRIHRTTTICAGLALLPFGLSLGLSVYVVLDPVLGASPARAGGVVFCMLAGAAWYGLGFFVRARLKMSSSSEHERATPLPKRIDQMLTEARVVLPGAQALLGFQFTVMLSNTFETIPPAFKLLHIGALCCVAIAIVLLMTPAALHRIAFEGRDAPEFFRMGSWLVIAAPAPLAVGIAADICVAVGRAAKSYAIGGGAAVGIFLLLGLLWYALPLMLRRRPQLAGSSSRF